MRMRGAGHRVGWMRGLAAPFHTALSFLTREALTFRLQKRSEGFSVVLTETAMDAGTAETVEGIHSTLVKSVSPSLKLSNSSSSARSVAAVLLASNLTLSWVRRKETNASSTS